MYNDGFFISGLTLTYYLHLLHLPADLGLSVVQQPGASLHGAAGDPAVDDVFCLNGLRCVINDIRLLSSFNIQSLEQFRVPNILTTD